METLKMNSDSNLNELLDKNIRIDSVLGRGGMGTVYRGVHLKLNRSVAVKVINPEIVHDQDANKRFEREAQLMAKLRHPNSAMIYDFGTFSDGCMFIVMEFVEGQPLDEILEQGVGLSIKQIIDIAVSICEVLEEAHSLGIVHRDLKPANIMLNKKGVFVLDFGIAKMLSASNIDTLKKSMTAAGTLVGTPYYMSLEQCLGEKLDGRSDLYSLGAVIYEMLSGRPPFDGEVVSAIIIKHATEQVLPLTELSKTILAGLSDTVRNLLEKKPDDRPANAQIARKLLLENLDETEKRTEDIPIAAPVPSVSELPTQQIKYKTNYFKSSTSEEINHQTSETTDSPPEKEYSGFDWKKLVFGGLALLAIVGFTGAGLNFLSNSETTTKITNTRKSDSDPYSTTDHTNHNMEGDDYAKEINIFN